MRSAPEVFFMRAGGGVRGQRLCLHHRPQGSLVRGAIVYVHPFAEEMNKSRRMAAMQSHALARAGYAVMQIDLLGCGDSSGDFGDATWVDWVEDVVEAMQWMRQRYSEPLWLWGLRAGCLLAVDAAKRIDEACNFLFWQPTTAGSALLQQFLRLKVVGEMRDGQAKGVMGKLHSQLASGESVEVAGYALSPGLADGLAGASLVPPPASGQLAWLEVSTRDGAGLLAASSVIVERWQQSGFQVRTQVVPGPAFWQTTEIEDAPALIDTTLAVLDEPVTA